MDIRLGIFGFSFIEQNMERQLESQSVDKVFTHRVSGKSTDRPALQEMLCFLREGDRLFVHSKNRLARNLVDLRQMAKTIKKLPNEYF